MHIHGSVSGVNVFGTLTEFVFHLIGLVGVLDFLSLKLNQIGGCSLDSIYLDMDCILFIQFRFPLFYL